MVARQDPLRNFRYRLEIDQIQQAGFAEVAIGDLSNEPIEYREGDDPTTNFKLPGKTKYMPLSFKRGYTPDGKDLWDWRKSVVEGRTERRSGTITLLNEARQPALVWRFYEAWPSKWAGPAFNAKNNDVAIEELELAHEGLELE